ncbi:MAG: SRPBCC domain-containing protein [bacterium]|nr:SRPBCC domain-containing protein [bacterium]
MATKKSTAKSAKSSANKTTKAKPKAKPAGRGEISYTTSNVFKAPLSKVWDAVVLSKHLKKHFVDDMKGEFGPKLTPVFWTWKGFGEIEIPVLKFVKHQEIIFTGMSMGGKYVVTVRYEFLRKDGKTIFRVHESGYPKKELKTAFMMCEGWSEFHTGVKAYLAGVDLRKY